MYCDRLLDGLAVERAYETMGRATAYAVEAWSDMCDPGDFEEAQGISPEGESETDADPKVVQQWRQDKLKKIREMKVWRYVLAQEAFQDPQAVIIDTTWVDDAIKGKSRLCGREFRSSGMKDDIFAGTPPLMAAKMLISEAATIYPGMPKTSLMVLDVRRAFLYGKARRSIYVKLPPEDGQGKGGAVMAKLERSIYGTRDAPQIWQEELMEKLKAIVDFDKDEMQNFQHCGKTTAP